jgi:signal transduction histidine kinase
LERGAGGAVLLHINITERKLMEGKLLEAERLRVLTTGLIGGQEEERRRLALELHDGLNQQVAALSIDLGLLARETDDLLQGEVKNLQKRTIDLSEQIRRISHSLHPAALDHLGCGSALRALAQEFSRSHEIAVDVSVDTQLDEPDRAQSLCLYRVAQECLANIGKHSGAKSVSLKLRALGPDTLELVIADDGHGFDVSTAPPKAGLGLASMQERVSLAGGCFALDSKQGYGTRVEIQLPRTKQQ